MLRNKLSIVFAIKNFIKRSFIKKHVFFSFLLFSIYLFINLFTWKFKIFLKRSLCWQFKIHFVVLSATTEFCRKIMKLTCPFCDLDLKKTIPVLYIAIFLGYKQFIRGQRTRESRHRCMNGKKHAKKRASIDESFWTLLQRQFLRNFETFYINVYS